MGRIWTNGTGLALNATNLNSLENDLGRAVKPWTANTNYGAGQSVIDPSGSLVAARTAHTSGTSYTAANWSAPRNTVNVDSFRAAGDTDDTQAWQRALTAAAAGTVSTIEASAKTYVISSPLDLAGISGLRIVGRGPDQTTIVSGLGATELTSAFTSSGNCSSITFDGIGWKGSAVDDVTGPRRSRTFGSNSIRRAIWLQGDLETGTNIIRDIRVVNCYAHGTSDLPMFLSGIRGEARIESSRFDLNYDIGFTNCELAAFIGNHVTRSCDNGVSLSRGNQQVVCVGNTFADCAYWAIWLAGYNTQIGASNFSVSGNSAVRMGYGGVTCDLGATNGTISGNHFRDLRRGPSDQPSDAYAVGVFIGGYPSNPAAVTSPAANITVTGNTIIDAQRGGVLVRGANNINITGNTIIRPGSQYMADGTTTITTAMATQNFGVAIDDNYITTVANSSFRGNLIVDDRTTPYLNNPAYIGSNAGTSSVGNVAYGNRLQVGESAETIRGGLKTYVAGLRVGSSGISGISLRVSAAAGSSRSIQLETDSTARWQVRADGSTESGSNAGSNLVFEGMTDTGTGQGASLTLIRSTGGVRHENKPLGFYGASPTAKLSVTGSKGGNAALGSLITALATLGLVTDGTTA